MGVWPAVYYVSFLRGLDQQLLPVSYRAMEVSHNLTISDFAGFTMCQGLGFALACPFWGILVDRGFSRKTTMQVGTTLCALLSLAMAFSGSFLELAFLRFLSGAARGMLPPVSQSFAQEVEESQRGTVIGLRIFFQYLGSMACHFLVLPMAETSVLGFYGWQFAWLATGIMSLGGCILIRYIMTADAREPCEGPLGLLPELHKLKALFSVCSYRALCMEGIFGTIPATATNFTTMYFQYVGLSTGTCALIGSVRITAGALGNLAAGLIGDEFNAYSLRYGRVIVAQVSVAAAILCAFGLFYKIPSPSEAAMTLGAANCLYFFFVAWPLAACISPTMCSIVPRSSGASAEAWRNTFVNLAEIVGPLLFSVLSDGLGYKPEDHATSRNTHALGHTLFVLTIVPHFLSWLALSVLLWTYQSDREAVAAVEASKCSGYGSTRKEEDCITA